MADFGRLAERAVESLPPPIEEGVFITLSSAQINRLHERVMALALAAVPEPAPVQSERTQQ